MRTLCCRDAGFDCKNIIRANTDDEVLEEAAKHALNVHGAMATPKLTAELRKLIKEE